MTAPDDLELLIDELVVSGARVDRAAVAAALRKELERLQHQGGQLDPGAGRDTLRVELPDRLADASALGTALARAIHGEVFR